VPAWTQPGYFWLLVAVIKTVWLYEPSKIPDGTYEVCGPHFQSNPEGFEEDILVGHGRHFLDGGPNRELDVLTPKNLRQWFLGRDIEGIVWHHSDGRMAKIKKSDLNLKRKE